MQLILALLLACAAAFGQAGAMGTPAMFPAQTITYADKVNGSDSNTGACQPHQINSGSTATCAVKTLAKVWTVASAIGNGAAIGLMSGSCQQWREQLTTSSKTYITVAAIGSGSAPLIDASDVAGGTDSCGTASALTWSKDTGTTWQASVTTATDAGGYVNAFKNGIGPGYTNGLVAATSKANCEATVNSYFPSSLDGGTWTLYINNGSTTLTPNTDGNLYEFSSRVTGIEDDNHSNSHITVSGIHTRRNHSNNGSLDLGQYATIYNSAADEGTKHNWLVSDGALVIGMSAHNEWCPTANGCNSPSGGGTLGVLYDANSAGAGSTFQNLTFTMDAFDAGIDSMYSHFGSGPGLGAIAFSNVTATNTAGFTTDFTTLSNFTGTNTAGITVYYPSVTMSNINATSTQGYPQISIPHDGTTLTASGVNLTCAYSNLGCVRISGASTLAWTGGTCQNNGSGGQCLYVDTGNVLPSLSISGVTFYGATGAGNQLYLFNVPTSANFDANTYHYGGGSGIRWAGTTYNWPANIAAWQALGFDAHSTWVSSTP